MDYYTQYKLTCRRTRGPETLIVNRLSHEKWLPVTNEVEEVKIPFQDQSPFKTTVTSEVSEEARGLMMGGGSMNRYMNYNKN